MRYDHHESNKVLQANKPRDDSTTMEKADSFTTYYDFNTTRYEHCTITSLATTNYLPLDLAWPYIWLLELILRFEDQS